MKMNIRYKGRDLIAFECNGIRNEMRAEVLTGTMIVYRNRQLKYSSFVTHNDGTLHYAKDYSLADEQLMADIVAIMTKANESIGSIIGGVL